MSFRQGRYVEFSKFKVTTRKFTAFLLHWIVSFSESGPLTFLKIANPSSRYKHQMLYQQNIRLNTTTNKNRKRNIIWFNPLYSSNVVTKVGKHFLSLLDKHFPPYNKFHEIFNRNTVKISYSCLPDMETIINSHNH